MTNPIRKGKDLRSAGLLFVLALLNVGCAELDRRAPQVWNTLSKEERRASLACGHDDLVIPSITSAFSRDPAGGVLAGFRTTFIAGPQPFPCNRVLQTSAQGVFHFDV